MTSRERFLTAVKNQKPDRVPACPCLSYMVPAKRTGKPFWDVFLRNNPPVWKAYLSAVDYFGIDGRMIYGGLEYVHDKKEVATETSVIEKNSDKIHGKKNQPAAFRG